MSRNWRRLLSLLIAALLVLPLFPGALAADLPFTQDNLFGSGGGDLSASGNTTQPSLNAGNPSIQMNSSGLGSLSLDQALRGSGLQQIQNNTQPLLRNTGSYTISWDLSDARVFIDNNECTKGQTVDSGLSATIKLIPGSNTQVTNAYIKYKASYIISGSSYDYDTFDGEEMTPLSDGSFSYNINKASGYTGWQLADNITITTESIRSYPVWVNGEKITKRNKADVFGGRQVIFDSDKNILMLNGASITSIVSNLPLTILFSGTNTISGTVQSDLGYGIYSNCALTLSAYSASDSLDVRSPSAQDSAGIYLKDANLTVSSGARVSASSGGASALSAGVHAGAVDVSGELTATGGNANRSCGVDCSNLSVKTVSAYSGGKVSAYGGDTYSGQESTGVCASGSVSVESGGALIAQGRVASGGSYGVRAGSFSNSGTADCSSGSGGSESIGLSASQSAASSGTLTATGGTSSVGTSYGVRATSFSVTGGSVNAQASAGGSTSRGISAATAISGGSVTAGGLSGAFLSKPTYSGYTPLVSASDYAGSTAEADASLDATYQRKNVMIRSRVLSVSPSAVTISVGETYALQASSAQGYSLRWYSSSPDVQVDSVTGIIKGMATGSAVITVQAYNAGTADAGMASCSVMVLPAQTQPAAVEVASVRFDQESVSLSQIGAIRTVKYYVTPATAAGAKLTWSSTDIGKNTVSLDVSEANGEFTLTALGNGSALITATAPNGREATCRVTVSGLAVKTANGQTVSAYIDYLGDTYGNAGVWFYDYSDMLRATCTAPLSSLQGVTIDGVWIPEVSGSVRNFTRYDAGGGKTGLHFSRAYLGTLSRGAHRLSLSYGGNSSAQKVFYIQSVRDAPRTGDPSLLPVMAAFLLSGGGLAAMSVIRRRKRNGI